MASARASQAAASAHRNSQAGADALPGGAAAPAYGNGRAASAPGASAAGAAARKVAGQAQAPVSPAAAQPGGDPDRVRRSAVALAACLACDICGGMLDDPVTAPECMHSFCRACIDAALPEAGRSAGAQCPVCAVAGEATMLGARPYADRRLQPDVVLAELARKLFPAADARRDAAFRLARARPRSGARREGAAARGRRRAATYALRERALPPGRRGRAEACGGEKAQAPACRACPVSAERRMRALLPAESRGAHAQARRADVEGGAPGHIARVRLPPRAPAQQMPLGQAVPLFVCPAEAPGGGAAPAGEAAELERPYLRVPPGMPAAALARYVAAQLGLLPGEAVGLSCGGRALAGDATLGDTLDEARGAGGAAGLVEYGVGGSGAESRMLVVCFRVLPPAEDAAPGPAAGGPAAAGAEPGGIDPDRGGGAGAAPLLPGAAEAAAWS